jgi:predicted nucleic acid-binding protein
VALLASAARLELDRAVSAWFNDVLALERTRQAPIDISVAAEAVALGVRGFRQDLADRFIYATAAREKAALVTKDTAIHAFAATDQTGCDFLGCLDQRLGVELRRLSLQGRSRPRCGRVVAAH